MKKLLPILDSITFLNSRVLRARVLMAVSQLRVSQLMELILYITAVVQQNPLMKLQAQNRMDYYQMHLNKSKL